MQSCFVDLSNVDLLAVIGRDTPVKRVAATHGGEYAGQLARRLAAHRGLQVREGERRGWRAWIMEER